MKKALVTLVLLVVSVLAFGQIKDEPTKFLGIPVDGDAKEFVEKVKQKGFTFTGYDKNGAHFKGTFAGYPNCEIIAGITPKSNLAWAVAVDFETPDNWQGLYSMYTAAKKLLEKEYGPADMVQEEFEGGDPGSDAQRYTEVEIGRCHYNTIYKTGNGLIRLCIHTDEDNNPSTILAYLNAINQMKFESEQHDD